MATFIIILELIIAVFSLYIVWYVLYIPKALRSADNFVRATINHYNLNNRGVNNEGKCSFSAGCAIGIQLPKLVCKHLDDGESKYHKLAFDFMRWKFRKINITDRLFVQTFHDRTKFWNKMGVSDDGIIRLKANGYGHLL